jgi:glutathione S-transferase
MKLYGSPNSPYARKTRILIKEKNLPVEFVLEDPWAEDGPLASRNPFNKVPVLEVGPDNYLFESIFIAHYLDNLDGQPLQPRDAEGYWHAQWWQALGNGIIDSLVARLLEARRPPEKQLPEKLAREEKRVRRAIDLAEHAFRGNRFLVGAAFTMADLVMGVALQYIDFRLPHDWRSPHPRLARWHAGIVSRRSFEETLPPGFVKPA